MEEVEKLFVWSCSVNCPHCDYSMDGWLTDPRGRTEECENCNKMFKIPEEVKFSF